MIAIPAYLGESSRSSGAGALAPSPLTPFDEILAERSGTGAQMASGAHAFNELGIFGLHNGQPMHLLSLAGSPQEAVRPRPTETAKATTAPDSARPASDVPPRAVAAAAERALPATPPVIPPAEARGTQPAASPVPAPFAITEAEMCVAQSPGKAVLPVFRPAGTPQETLTIVSADGRDVGIAVRADIGDADAAQLRRRLDAAAAEFGMRLGSVRLNGAAQAIHPHRGGRHGRHTG